MSVMKSRILRCADGAVAPMRSQRWIGALQSGAFKAYDVTESEQHLPTEQVWEDLQYATIRSKLRSESVGGQPYRYWGPPGCPWRWRAAHPQQPAPTADVPSQDTAPRPVIALGEEEISDVSLATFYVFDKENAGTSSSANKLARACGGCRGCGGCAARGCGTRLQQAAEAAQ